MIIKKIVISSKIVSQGEMDEIANYIARYSKRLTTKNVKVSIE